MIGDKLNIKQFHVDAAQGVMELIAREARHSGGKFILTVAGESGAGKSEIAFVLAEKLLAEGMKSIILQQDDYFMYPPETNAAMRKKDIGHVGLSEVRLSLLDQNLKDILDGGTKIEKPLVIYKEDRITSEKLSTEGIKTVIVEGTYVTLLSNVHRRVFIDRSHLDTVEARRERAREKQDDYLVKILEIEHGIIAPHKAKADIIITRDYNVRMGGAVGG
jgi:uridine kinase